MRSFRPGSSTSLRSAGAVTLVLLVAPALVACQSEAESTSAQTIKVSASDTACELSAASVAAGSVRFEAKNSGTQVTEVYVYAADDSIVTEKEDIGPGTSVTFNADLPAGKFVVACKPGQKGDGIRTDLTATSESTATSTPTPSESDDK